VTLIDSTEATEILGIPVGTLRRYATLGYVPSLKISRAANGHRYFERDVIETFASGWP
jgi:DNA-binding transcriptional MerR regulator